MTERTLQYADVVATIGEAWAFVMDHLDELGPTPRIMINPVHWVKDGIETTWLEVSVSATTELPEPSRSTK